MNENLIDRIRLLYERNNSSPLFLKIADLYISNNEVAKARQILEQGIKFYPQHPLAYILLGKVKFILGNTNEADSLFKTACDILDSERTYIHYKESLNQPDEPDKTFKFFRGNFFDNTLVSDNSSVNENETIKSSNSIDDRLEEIAAEMMNAKIERDNNFSLPEKINETFIPDKSKLASETLANIFLSQGEKNEAIKIYEILIDRNPDKKAYYLEKISDIKSR